MRIIVAGGTGFLGTALVDALRRGAHQVSVLTRRPRRPDDVAWAPGSGNGQWKRAVDGADAVVNLAGAPIADRRWTDARKRLILESRVHATRALVEAVKEARTAPAVFLSGSAIGVYGVHADEALSEDSPPGSDFLASVCTDWEAEARRADGVTRVVLLRTGLVLGKAGGALVQLARPFRLFVGGRLGSGRQYMSWIHRDDWVSMVQWALAAGSIAGPLNLTAPQPVRNAELAHVLGRVLKRPAIVPAPAFALRIALGEMADAMVLGGQRVLPRKALDNGFAFKHPAVEAALRAIYST